MTKPAMRPVLADRYAESDGTIYMTGLQTLVRLPLEQMRADAAAGLRTKGFITGYPGSPLGSYDIALAQAKPMLADLGITHLPGQNEELAATALTGTQMLDNYPHPDVDGVVGYWYGKGPGLDRAGDALKHGNFAGTSKHGAVVVLSGEDHEAKSSTVPYQQEFAFEHHGIPVLYPATVSEFMTFGLHAAALSRYSGCWTAMKLVGPLCDGGESVDLAAARPNIILPELEIDGAPFRKSTDFGFFPVLTVAHERRLYEERHLAVAAYGRANGLDRVILSGEGDRIGIVTAGKSYADTREALRDLGFDEATLRRNGVRIAKIGMLAPADSVFLRDFARGLEWIIVIEEKRDFLERQVGRAVCELGPIQVVGKYDSNGKPLFPIAGGMDSDLVAEKLAQQLEPLIGLPERGRERLRTLASARATKAVSLPRRTPNYCSGCPHNVSTKLAPGQSAWGAPGCHVFASLMEQPERKIEALTQLGGEGLPWIGLSRYTSKEHIVQNVGDGALFHSSFQNIRFAVSSGVNITYRILYNGVVANTGGQERVGDAEVPLLLSKLVLEGVKKIILIASDPQAYRSERLPDKVEVRDSSRVQSSMAELAEIEGVTVLIYDGECANERRRRQKRGKLPPPDIFTVVNEDACENCGDCGAKANCMSLQKVETELGAKTQIHQSSCNQDRACLDGDCPSFVTVKVEPGTKIAKPKMPDFADDMPEPAAMPSLDTSYHIYVPGVGGTGVITTNAILAQAATLDGNAVKSFDQTGAAQKWGAVLSSLILAKHADSLITNKVGVAEADLYLALDAMAGADRTNLMCCDSDRTAAIISSDVLPSGEMIRNVHMAFDRNAYIHEIATHTSSHHVLAARTIAERLFGSYMMTNMVAVGAAYQAGLLPISAASIEQAITMNGTQARANIMAFRAGRISQIDPDRLSAMIEQPYGTLADHLSGVMARPGADAKADRLLAGLPPVDDATRTMIARRAVDLDQYQNAGLARRYVDVVGRFAAQGRSPDLVPTVARNLYKLMAYKDEYETARLLSDPIFAERVREQFPGFRAMMINLQPPLMRHFGLNKKIALGPWFMPLLRTLAKFKFVRGSLFDPFGHNPARKAERDAIGWYIDLVDHVRENARAGTQADDAELLALPESIRGYEDIKLRSLDAARKRASAILQRYGATKHKEAV